MIGTNSSNLRPPTGEQSREGIMLYFTMKTNAQKFHVYSKAKWLWFIGLKVAIIP